MSMVVLSKLYSRETTLFYFGTWDLSDRNGSERYIGEALAHNIRIAPPRGQNGEIWFSRAELEHLMQKALERINSDAALRDTMVANTKAAWQKIRPYFEEGKKISSVQELSDYFDNITEFWCTMNTPIFQLFENDKLDATFKARMFEIREATQHHTQRMSDNFVEFFESHFPALKHLAFHVTRDDVRALEEGKADMHVLEQRAKEGCALFRGVVYPLSRLDAVLAENNMEFEKVDAAAVTEVKGNAGFKGKVRGKVALVGSQAELEKVREGDVLVSSATDPGYVQAMSRASAFVTDEGGIMSHAAIVAREMKKPCVIGTKVATQVFKDGDMVEVDADNGIVRKI